MYRKRLSFDPSTENIEELRVLSEKIPDISKDEVQYQYYESCSRNISDLKFRTLTGYGQCRGRLIVYSGSVVICCCREMAALVAYGNAYYQNGHIHIPGRKGSAAHHGGSVYIINDSEGQSFDQCPFCSAQVQEKIYCTEEPAPLKKEE